MSWDRLPSLPRQAAGLTQWSAVSRSGSGWEAPAWNGRGPSNNVTESQTQNRVPDFVCSAKYGSYCVAALSLCSTELPECPPHWPTPLPQASAICACGHLHMHPLRKEGRPVTPIGGHTGRQLAHVSDFPECSGPSCPPPHPLMLAGAEQ